MAEIELIDAGQQPAGPDLAESSQSGCPDIATILTFRLGSHIFGLDIAVVVQVIPMLKIRPLTETNGVIEGVINVRGELAPVLDLHRRFGLPEAHRHLDTPIILARLNGRLVGLIVDQAMDVLHLKPGQALDPHLLFPPETPAIPALQGVVYMDHGPVALINLEHILKPGLAGLLFAAIDRHLSPPGEEPFVDEPSPAKGRKGGAKLEGAKPGRAKKSIDEKLNQTLAGVSSKPDHSGSPTKP
jgi:purine-binding chemotaxis protein CheW